MENNELSVIDNSIEVFRGGGAIIQVHKNRAALALKAAGSILQAWDDAYAIPDPKQRAEALAAIDV